VKLGRTRSVALAGLDGALVDVEADLVQGLPQFLISGLPDAACKQSPDRIKAAAANSGVPVPNRRWTVNLSPASMPKGGSGFDLAKVDVNSLMGAVKGGGAERSRLTTERRGRATSWGCWLGRRQVCRSLVGQRTGGLVRVQGDGARVRVGSGSRRGHQSEGVGEPADLDAGRSDFRIVIGQDGDQ